MSSPRIIYDFGANNGDDVAYYIQKADKVVAVEANPALAAGVEARFRDEIAAGRLVVEACVLTDGPAAEAVPFHVHKTNHVESQFPKPPASRAHLFEEIRVPSQNVVDLIRRHGEPHYVKLDIEHYDQVILGRLFRSGIRPPYISAESHTIEVFALMVAAGYAAFKLVDGASVLQRYGQATIATAGGPRPWSFPEHSAGPFGEDIAGPWMTRNNFFRVLAFAGLGWRDIHASRVDAPDERHAPKPRLEIDY
jgi:FkbM family methyltransferase